MEFIENMITNSILSLHTAYLGMILAIDGNRATVQPLSRYKERGREASEQAVVSALILHNARYKLREDTCYHNYKWLTYDPLAVGDVVLCVVCERDISGQTGGQITTPNETLNFSLSNSVIVGAI